MLHGGVFAWATGYADDLKLLTPSVKALKILATICEQYADKFDVLFNGMKSLSEQYPTYTESSDLFFNDVNLPSLTHEQKEYCDQEIIESEILKSLKTLKHGKKPWY